MQMLKYTTYREAIYMAKNIDYNVSFLSKYVDTLRQCEIELRILDNVDSLLSDLKDLLMNIQNFEFIIPIIGDFSSGKSSLINAFLGENLLAVGITPETAFPTELRYSQQEYIEAINGNNVVTKYGVNKIKELKNIAQDISLVRIYKNNPKLREILPFIIVDMPGFESPYDTQNKAIMDYLDRSVHFIFLISAEGSTLTAKSLRVISDILNYEKGITFILSKSDLKTEKDLEKITSYFKEQLNDRFDIDCELKQINFHQSDKFFHILKDLDAEKIFRNIYIGTFKKFLFDVNNILNIKISSLEKDFVELENFMKSLNDRKTELLNKRDELLSQIETKYQNKYLQIFNKISSELYRNADYLVEVYRKSGEKNFYNELEDIVRSILIYEFKLLFDDILNDITEDLLFELRKSNIDFDIFLGEDFLISFENNVKNIRIPIKTDLKNKNFDVVQNLASLISIIISKIISKLPLILFDLIISILKKIFEKAEIKNKIINEIIPTIKNNLRDKIKIIYLQQISEIIDHIHQQFRDILNKIDETIKREKENMDNKKTVLEQIKNKIIKAKTNINSILNSLIGG